MPPSACPTARGNQSKEGTPPLPGSDPLAGAQSEPSVARRPKTGERQQGFGWWLGKKGQELV